MLLEQGSVISERSPFGNRQGNPQQALVLPYSCLTRWRYLVRATMIIEITTYDISART